MLSAHASLALALARPKQNSKFAKAANRSRSYLFVAGSDDLTTGGD